MSKALHRMCAALVLVALCGWFAVAQPPPGATLEFKGNTPAPGQKGEVVVLVDWKMCAGADKLDIALFKLVMDKNVTVTSISVKAGPDGAFAHTFKDIASGTKINAARAKIIDAKGQNVIVKDLNPLPMPFAVP